MAPILRIFTQRGRIAAYCLALLLLPLQSQGAEVRELRLWRAPDHTRLVLDLSGPVEHQLLELKDPRRLVIDVADARLATDTASLALDNTPIQAVRSGIRNGNDLRLVLDLRAAVRPRSFALRASERADDRLVIDLYDLATERHGTERDENRAERRQTGHRDRDRRWPRRRGSRRAGPGPAAGKAGGAGDRPGVEQAV
jgi:hypothetical protein